MWRTGRKYFCRIQPVNLEWPNPVDLKDGFALANSKVAHRFRHQDKASSIHGGKLGTVKHFAGADPERTLEHRYVFISWVPMRRDFGAIRTSDTKYEWFSLSARISRNICVFTAHETRSPLEFDCAGQGWPAAVWPFAGCARNNAKEQISRQEAITTNFFFVPIRKSVPKRRNRVPHLACRPGVRQDAESVP